MPESLTDEDWLKQQIEECLKQIGAADHAIVNNPNAYPNMAWISSIYKHLRGIYELETDLLKYIKRTDTLLEQILASDRSVPRQELEARAELLGLFVKALRDRTTQGGISP